MENNVGGHDRTRRWIFGGALALYALQSRGWKRWLGLTVAASVLGSAAAQKCLINRWLGVNSCAPKNQPSDELISEASEESFPASDPPAFAGQR